MTFLPRAPFRVASSPRRTHRIIIIICACGLGQALFYAWQWARLGWHSEPNRATPGAQRLKYRTGVRGFGVVLIIK